MKQLAYLILNYNSAGNTVSLIESIRSFDSINFIVVVDNNSTDDSANRLSGINEHLNFQLLISEINGGYAKGNNLGLQYISDHLQVDFVFICNPDIILKKSNVEVLSDLLLKNTDCSLAGIQMKDEHGNILTSAWRLPSIWHDLIISSSLLRGLFGNPLLYKCSNELQYVEVIQGAFFIVRLSCFKEIGFFDSRTFLYAEERIIGYKMKTLGKKLLFDPKHSFVHAVGASINQKFPTNLSKYKLIFRSRVIYHRIVNERSLNWRIYSMLGSILYIEKGILDLLFKCKGR